MMYPVKHTNSIMPPNYCDLIAPSTGKIELAGRNSRNNSEGFSVATLVSPSHYEIVILHYGVLLISHY
jgi:hypothetical protein